MAKSTEVPYARLLYSWDMILSIEDFINCIDLHKKDLKSPRNIGLMNFNFQFLGNEDFNPAGVLKDYIYLEANSFFECAKHLKANGDENIPDLPIYFLDLQKFRNILVAHRDKRKKIEFPKEWIELQEKTAKLIPINQLIKDVDEYYHQVIKRYKESRKNFRPL